METGQGDKGDARFALLIPSMLTDHNMKLEPISPLLSVSSSFPRHPVKASSHSSFRQFPLHLSIRHIQALLFKGSFSRFLGSWSAEERETTNRNGTNAGTTAHRELEKGAVRYSCAEQEDECCDLGFSTAYISPAHSSIRLTSAFHVWSNLPVPTLIPAPPKIQHNQCFRRP